MEYPWAYYVEHVSMESDTLERIELFGPYRYLLYAVNKKKLCEGEEDTISAKVVKYDLVKKKEEYAFEDDKKEL